MPICEARVVAVVTNWNGVHLLDETLAGIEAQGFPDLETLVVDNGSMDGSLEHLAERWPDVHVLKLGENVGFAVAVNRGFEASAGDYVAVLNNDMTLEPGWAGTLANALDRTPAAASAVGKLLVASRPDVLDGAGDVIGWDGYCVRRGRGEADRAQYDEPELVFSACAGAAMYRRAAFESVGPFDERFFIYVEDADWGFRAQLAGHDCLYEPEAVAHHVGGATTGGMSGLELYLFHRNTVSMMVKDFPLAALAMHSPWAVGRRLASLAKATRAGQGRIVLRAWRDALRDLPASIRLRRPIQRNRVRGYRELSRMVPVRTPIQR
jgi:GT2 family glycosyltransferase